MVHKDIASVMLKQVFYDKSSETGRLRGNEKQIHVCFLKYLEVITDKINAKYASF